MQTLHDVVVTVLFFFVFFLAVVAKYIAENYALLLAFLTGAVITSVFLFLTRLCCPDFPRRDQKWKVWVQLEAWHAAAHDVHRRLPPCNAGSDGGASWHADHEDLQHQCHELHPRGAGPGAPEADAAGCHIWRRPRQAGDWLVTFCWFVCNKLKCCLTRTEVGVGRQLAPPLHASQMINQPRATCFVNEILCLRSWQLANELRWLQRTERLGLETRLWSPRARPDNAQLLWRRNTHGSRQLRQHNISSLYIIYRLTKENRGTRPVHGRSLASLCKIRRALLTWHQGHHVSRMKKVRAGTTIHLPHSPSLPAPVCLLPLCSLSPFFSAWRFGWRAVY